MLLLCLLETLMLMAVRKRLNGLILCGEGLAVGPKLTPGI